MTSRSQAGAAKACGGHETTGWGRSAARCEGAPATGVPEAPRALAAIVWAGEAPVGLMLVRDGSLVVVADSTGSGGLSAP